MQPRVGRDENQLIFTEGRRVNPSFSLPFRFSLTVIRSMFESIFRRLNFLEISSSREDSLLSIVLSMARTYFSSRMRERRIWLAQSKAEKQNENTRLFVSSNAH